MQFNITGFSYTNIAWTDIAWTDIAWTDTDWQGRSPYDDGVVIFSSPEPMTMSEADDIPVTWYRERDERTWDEHGRPVNLETRQMVRDHIRASNEVMQAAGIIEETAEVKARDKAAQDSLAAETETGLRRLEIGRVVLVAGVWGVCGLRRRILLYNSYSNQSIIDIIHQEAAVNSIPHILGAGLPAFGLYQTAEWVSLINRALVSGPYKDSAENAELQISVKESGKWIWRNIIDIGFPYIMLHYQAFAMLQQLNLISSDRLFPSLLSLVPFSRDSPLQLPPLPASYTSSTVMSWTIELLRAAAPMGMIFLYGRIYPTISTLIYAPLYRSLPRPVNRGFNLNQALDEATAQAPRSSEATNNQSFSSSDSPGTYSPPDPSMSAEHAATLRALEGRSAPDLPTDNNDNNDGGDDTSSETSEDHELAPTTLISFDVEPNILADTPVGAWSAELRSMPDATTNANNEDWSRGEPRTPPIYRITALTMLPPLLAAEGFSALATGFVLLPVEALIVRTLGRAYRRSAGLEVADMLPPGMALSWQSMFNVLSVQAAELAVTGVLWAVITATSFWLDGIKIGAAEEEEETAEDPDTNFM